MGTQEKVSFEEFCRRATLLPCAPRLLPRLISAMKEPESAAERIGEIIRQDSGLAASTLRLANSASYGREIPIADLTQAIVVLGRSEIYRIAARAMVARWEEAHQKALPWGPGALSQHSLSVAVAAEALGGLRGIDDVTTAYTAGLVGDVGLLALAFVCSDVYPRVSTLSRNGGCRWEEAESRVLGFNNRTVGAALMRSWNFPSAFVTMVAFQNNADAAPPQDRPFIAQMQAARYLANSLGSFGTPEEFYFEPQQDLLARHGYTPALLKDAYEKAKAKMERKVGLI